METPAGPLLSFDRLAALFDDQRALPPAAVAALHRAFIDLVDDGFSTLIEPGAGTGRIAIPALAAGLHVTALDISRPMLDALEARLANLPELAERCEPVVGDATALPFANDRFDAGVLAQVLYLVPAWELALDELVRVVRAGGRVMLVQERTEMTAELARWDAAWRNATDRAGHVAISQVPDDATVVAALASRSTDVVERALSSWDFGQTVGDGLAGLGHMRPLYASLPDRQWDAALAEFRHWHAVSDLASDTWLGGTVTLITVAGTVSANDGEKP